MTPARSRTIPSAAAGSRLRVLCVDDEPHVLQGLRLHLGRHYEVLAATSGALGLEILHRERDIAVVISDMCMPITDGASFLRLARDIAPDAARILLTGHTDPVSGAEAVNHGQICAYLFKPCPPQTLTAAVNSAASRYRMNVAQRVLAEGLPDGEAPTALRYFELAVRMFGCGYAAMGVHVDRVWPPRRVHTHNLESDIFMVDSAAERPSALHALLNGAQPLQHQYSPALSAPYGLPAKHPPVTQMLAVPLATAARSYGWIHFADARKSPLFTADDTRAAVMFARACAECLDGDVTMYGEHLR